MFINLHDHLEIYMVIVEQANPRTCLATRNIGNNDSINGLNKFSLVLAKQDFLSNGSAPTPEAVTEITVIVMKSENVS